MTPEQGEQLLQILQGNVDAAAFCADAMHVLHFWDDLVDRDKPLTDDQINAAMWRALIDMPRNPFYHKHVDTLSAVLMVAISDWMTATKSERKERACLNERSISFSIRSSYLNVIVMAAILVGGPAYGLAVAEPLRQFFHNEGLTAYIKNLRVERAAREQSHV